MNRLMFICMIHRVRVFVCIIICSLFHTMRFILCCFCSCPDYVYSFVCSSFVLPFAVVPHDQLLLDFVSSLDCFMIRISLSVHGCSKQPLSPSDYLYKRYRYPYSFVLSVIMVSLSFCVQCYFYCPCPFPLPSCTYLCLCLVLFVVRFVLQLCLCLL